MAKCVFAGTFDPITKGHESIIKSCLSKYDSVLVVIGKNDKKTCYFTEEERYNFAVKTFEKYSNVTVIKYSDYGEKYFDFVKEKGYTVYVRGIRNDKDLQYEKEMEEKNKVLYPFFTTEYIQADEKVINVSSTAVRELIKNGQDFKAFVPDTVYADIKSAIKEKN